MLAVQPVAPLPGHQLLVFLLQLGILLLLAFLLGRLAMRFAMPAIVGELCAGVLLGPSVLEQLSPGISHWLLPRETGQFHMLDATAQLGVLLLVALTGIHMDLSLIRRRRSAILRISVLGLVVPLALGVGAGLLLPDSLVPDAADRTTFALFLGIVMGVSAIPVIAKTLMDLRLLHRNIGQLTLCAVMVDDMVGWLLLSVVSTMATTGIRAGNITVSLAWPLVVVLAAVGLRMDISALARPSVLLTGLAVLAVAVVGKFTGAYAGARLSGLNHWEGLALGAGMNSRGVIEVVIAIVGLRLGVLGPEMYTIVVLVAIATSLMAPPVLRATMSRGEHTAEERLRERDFQGTRPSDAGNASLPATE